MPPPHSEPDPSRVAVFTGTFDPLTLGHLDVIRRGCVLFERLVVAVGINPNKQALFDVDERVSLAQDVVRPYANVSVEPSARVSSTCTSWRGRRADTFSIVKVSDPSRPSVLRSMPSAN